MEPKGFHRKLTAMLNAGVSGYSRFMQGDEAATVRTLGAYKQIFSDLIRQHRGRVVGTYKILLEPQTTAGAEPRAGFRAGKCRNRKIPSVCGAVDSCSICR
jgi:hypothetical protein